MSKQAQENIKKALLNVMEDLEEARALLQVEKVKDEAMLASIGEGLIAVDMNRKVLVINKAAEDMLGWNGKDLIGTELTRLPLEDDEGHRIVLNRRPTSAALSTGKVTNGTFFFVKKDKTRLPIAITVTPIKLGDKIIGAVDIFRDVTHELEIDKAKSEFISLASHQLRSPLGIIKWYLEALENEDYFKKLPKAVRVYFDQIYKSNERILSLVRDLLSVSRIEQGHVKHFPESINLILVVKKIVKKMQIIAHKKKVFLHVAIPNQNIPPLHIDLLRFHEAIENLICNALEYTKATGSVFVTIQKEEKTFSIRIKDTGIGISAPDQKKLFTKFFRSEKAIEYNPEGTGLGLYVVKSYVESWGGKIVAHSVEGKGSTFTVSLPISQKETKRRYSS